MGQANIDRGEKWKKKLAELEFQKERGVATAQRDIEWLMSQKSITDDIAEYENSIKKEETKSKGKK